MECCAFGHFSQQMIRSSCGVADVDNRLINRNIDKSGPWITYAVIAAAKVVQHELRVLLRVNLLQNQYKIPGL